MPQKPQGYSLAVRLSHVLTFGLFVAAGLTGLRLAWLLDTGWLSVETTNALDSIVPTGRVFLWHLLFGIAFGAVGIFYLVYVFSSGESWRLFDIFRGRHYSMLHKVGYLLTFLLAAVCVVTGVSMYAGMYFGPDGFIFNSLLHHWCFRLLAIFLLIHAADTILVRRQQLNEIFFARRGDRFLVWPALIVAIVIAIGAGSIMMRTADSPQTLICHEQQRVAVVDGREYDIEWSIADSVTVQTMGGANLPAGNAPVTLKAFHNGRRVYLLARWNDPTRSYNRHLVKGKAGWSVERSAYIGLFGEEIYSEDGLALMFRGRADCASSCHIRAPGKMGLHYTVGDTADGWMWLAVRTNPVDEADDRWWGGFVDGLTGGRHFDNKAAGGYRSNLDEQWQQPYFVPLNARAHDWILYGSNTYRPFDPENDTFAIGTLIPSELVAPTTGDRGDVTAKGLWRNGVWTVEFSRLISTGSDQDVPLRGELYLGVAVFDNADSKHSYHLKPIRLVLE